MAAGHTSVRDQQAMLLQVTSVIDSILLLVEKLAIMVVELLSQNPPNPLITKNYFAVQDGFKNRHKIQEQLTTINNKTISSLDLNPQEAPVLQVLSQPGTKTIRYNKKVWHTCRVVEIKLQ